jgi:hypothetical protein
LLISANCSVPLYMIILSVEIGSNPNKRPAAEGLGACF